MKIYTKESIEKELEELKDWHFVNNGIEKKYQFKDFKQALGFIVQMGTVAEKINHHPELNNVYNKISIRLTTHDYNGVTNKDIELAKELDKI